MKKFWVLQIEDNGKITNLYGHSNYYTFCAKVKKILAEADQKAIQAFVSELGETSYDPELKARFRAVHDSVIAKYRLISTMVDDTFKTWENPVLELKEFEDHANVLKFLWQTKPIKKKEK
jgi:hypothetical protein